MSFALARLAFFGFLLASLLAPFALGGCERQVAPPLVEVTELAPREIEPADRLEVHGTGFPQGRLGHITFEGTAYRPGEPPLRGVKVEAEGTVVAPDRLEIVVRESFVEQICGRGDHAAHATFRGDLEVSFASSTPGAPPLVGKHRDASIDVQPASVRASILDSRAAEGGHVLAYLGIVPGASTPRGIPVEQVTPGSTAERTGFQTGDVLVALDGVHLLSLADVVPLSSRSADLTMRHGDSGAEETKTVSLVAYSADRVPSEYASALLVVGLALAVLVLLVLPGPPSLAALEMRIASQVRRTSLAVVLAAVFGRGRAAAVSAIATAVASAFALTPWVVGREVDGLALFAAAASLLVWSRAVRANGFVASLRAVLQAGMILLVMGAALALGIAQVGAIELSEIVRAQGGLPWQAEATRHPACAILAVVYGVSLLALLRGRAPAEPLLERAGIVLASALGVAVFFGGWQLPGILDPRAHGLVVLGGLLFVAKTWAATALLLGARQVASGLAPAAARRLVLRKILPGLVLAGALVAVARRIVPSVAVETAIGATLVALAALLLVRVAARVRTAVARPEPHASPFL